MIVKVVNGGTSHSHSIKCRVHLDLIARNKSIYCRSKHWVMYLEL